MTTKDTDTAPKADTEEPTPAPSSTPPAADAPPAPDAPPEEPKAPRKRTPGKRTPTGNPPGRPKGSTKLRGQLAGFLATIGTVVSLANAEDGAAILENAENIATELDKLAQQNPAVRRVLEQMMAGSAIGGLVLALLPVAIRIAANHGAPVPPLAVAMMGGPIPTADAGGLTFPFLVPDAPPA